MKTFKTQVGRVALGTLACLFMMQAAQATPLKADATISSAIIAGNFDGLDAPTFAGAPIVPYDQFTGVVSIFIDYGDAGGFICTGSAIGQRHILTAAHCVDETGTGQVIDLSNPDYQVLAVFNNDEPFTADFAGSVRSAANVTIHPDYHGFGICGPGETGGFFGQCLNDDLAIIELDQDIPDGVEIYGFDKSDRPLDNGSLLTMVGHGVSGDGFFGEYLPPSFADKRIGFNLSEFFDCDDETSPLPASGGFLSSGSCGDEFGNSAEVWYADFDGYDFVLDELDGPGDGQIDTFCLFFGVGCGNGLGDDLDSGLYEAAIAGGDSGGPSFIYDHTTGKWLLAANNTFGTNGLGPFGIPGAFGEVFGGNVYRPYLSWIDTFVEVPEPASLGLLSLGLVMIGLSRRRRKV